MDQQVLVIGGGIGGLSVAADLLSQGVAVTLLEKNMALGGAAGRRGLTSGQWVRRQFWNLSSIERPFYGRDGILKRILPSDGWLCRVFGSRIRKGIFMQAMWK